MVTIGDSCTKTDEIILAIGRCLRSRAVSLNADPGITGVTVTVKMDKLGLHPRVTLVNIHISDEYSG